MADTNYISSIVRILEVPKHTILKNNISVTQFRVQLPQVRKAKIVTLVFWGNLARDVANNYKVNDYILVEGYISLVKKPKPVFKRVEIAVLRVYPFLFTQDRNNR